MKGMHIDEFRKLIHTGNRHALADRVYRGADEQLRTEACVFRLGDAVLSGGDGARIWLVVRTEAGRIVAETAGELEAAGIVFGEVQADASADNAHEWLNGRGFLTKIEPSVPRVPPLPSAKIEHVSDDSHPLADAEPRKSGRLPRYPAPPGQVE